MALFKPDDYLGSVVDIDPDALVDQGFSVVLLDIDNTLVPRDTHLLSDEVAQWVAALRQRGLRPCLFSNNWHQAVVAYADALNIPIVYKAMKPLPFAYPHALRKAGWKRGEKVVAIGDQIMTDVLGAHLRGYHAILVLPQATRDLWYTHLLRRIERLFLRNQQPRC